VLSLAELRRAVALLDAALRDARVDRVIEPDPRRVVLVLHMPGGGGVCVLACCDPPVARLSLVANRPPATPTPPAFAQLLRARLGGARCLGARIVDEDRQAALRFEGEAGRHELLLALLGPRSNVYLLDGAGRVVGALRPLSETRRDLAPGAPTASPGSPTTASSRRSRRPPPSGRRRSGPTRSSGGSSGRCGAPSSRSRRSSRCSRAMPPLARRPTRCAGAASC
jgi:predicted ribosome quality control (RQC) complex YloA/Tae2 family protein